jgi:hypothetical protein
VKPESVAELIHYEAPTPVLVPMAPVPIIMFNIKKLLQMAQFHTILMFLIQISPVQTIWSQNKKYVHPLC